jgi:hypothetical protein
MTCLPENEATISLARSAGMRFVPDPLEPRADLELPEPSSDELLAEAWREALASIDLGFGVANAALTDSGPVTSA